MRWIAAVLAVSVLVQDPERPPPRRAEAPADAAPLPPIPETWVSTVRRDDLIQRFQPPTGLEGFWELAECVRAGRTVADVRGWLAIGRRHLSVHVYERAPDGGVLVQSGFRTYRVEGDRIVMTAVSGHDNHAGGRLGLDPPGFVEVHGFAIVGTRLRIELGEAAHFDFVRLE